jgi:hypothetical protein
MITNWIYQGKRKKKNERERMTQGKGGTRILNVSDEIMLKHK